MKQRPDHVIDAKEGATRPTFDRSRFETRQEAKKPPAVTVASYPDHTLYPRICRAVAAILAKHNFVSPVEVLIGMDLLRREHLEDWRRGRVPYLERVITCNLTRLSTLLRVLRFHAHDLNLKPSFTVYNRHSKGPKHRLRFTKTGDAKLEEAYATHLVWPGKGPFPPERLRPPTAAKEERKAVEFDRLPEGSPQR